VIRRRECDLRLSELFCFICSANSVLWFSHASSYVDSDDECGLNDGGCHICDRERRRDRQLVHAQADVWHLVCAVNVRVDDVNCVDDCKAIGVLQSSQNTSMPEHGVDLAFDLYCQIGVTRLGPPKGDVSTAMSTVTTSSATTTAAAVSVLIVRIEGLRSVCMRVFATARTRRASHTIAVDTVTDDFAYVRVR
jgi:hypothetical protein